MTEAQTNNFSVSKCTKVVTICVRLLQIKHYIQFTDIGEVFVDCFYEEVNKLKNTKLVFIRIHSNYKVQGRIPPVDYLVVLKLDEQALDELE